MMCFVETQRRKLMLLQKRFVILSVLLVFSLLLSACNLASQGSAVDPASQQATIDAAVVLTMQTSNENAVLTAQALATSTFTPSPTLEPTATATQTATATETAIPPTATKTYIPPTQKPSVTFTPFLYGCKIVSSSPSSGAKININTDFDAVWTVQNIGSRDWEAGYIDLRFSSGEKMQTVGDVFDVAALIKGGELKLIVDMKAPAAAGKYTASWVLTMEGITMCTLPITIEAVTP
jgi:hypothetical protein